MVSQLLKATFAVVALTGVVCAGKVPVPNARQLEFMDLELTQVRQLLLAAAADPRQHAR